MQTSLSLTSLSDLEFSRFEISKICRLSFVQKIIEETRKLVFVMNENCGGSGGTEICIREFFFSFVFFHELRASESESEIDLLGSPALTSVSPTTWGLFIRLFRDCPDIT